MVNVPAVKDTGLHYLISTLVIRDFTEKSTLRVVAAWNCLRELESHRRLQQLSTASSLIAAAAVAKSSWCQYRSTLGTVIGLIMPFLPLPYIYAEHIFNRATLDLKNHKSTTTYQK